MDLIRKRMNQTSTPTGQPITVSGDETWARLQKVRTPKGTRVRIESAGGDSRRIDPLALESITWQDGSVIESLRADLPPVDESGGDPPADAGDQDTIRLVNEFADAEIETVDGGTGVEVTATKLGYSIRLDAADLAALARADTETFSGFLSEPFGPIEGDYHGPPG